MKHLDFWFDPVSPYGYLAFEQLPKVLEGLSYEVAYRPVLFAGLLKHWGQKGPAEIEPKRAWTFRQAHWHAHVSGISMDTPSQHPFNPLVLLRFLLASAPPGCTPGRNACEQVLKHVWQGGADANDPDRLGALRERLSLTVEPDDAAVKQMLRDSTAEAVAQGVFGVPTVVCEGRHFWGVDGLGMLGAFLRGDSWFDGPAWTREGAPRDGVVRNASAG